MSAPTLPAAPAPAASAEDTPAPKPKGILEKLTDAITGRNAARAAQEAAEQERDDLASEVEAAAGQIAALTAERARLTADLASAKSSIEELTAERDELEAAAQTSAEAGGQIAADMLAQHGASAADLPATDTSADGGDQAGQLTTAEFRKLSQKERHAFLRSGGKISDKKD